MPSMVDENGTGDGTPTKADAGEGGVAEAASAQVGSSDGLLPTSAYFEPMSGIVDKSTPAAPLGYVKGGGAVLSGPYEKQMQTEWHDAERRRAERDEEKRIAGIPIDEGGGMEYEHNLAPEGEGVLPEGKIFLRHVTSRHEPIYRNGLPVTQLADVELPDVQSFPGELMLIIFCPRCLERRLLPVDHCMINVKQGHRRWHLSEKTRGEAFVWEDGKLYKSLGEICESDRITCSTCGWSCHIDKNEIISE